MAGKNLRSRTSAKLQSESEQHYRAVSDQLRKVTDTMSVAVAYCSRDLRYVWVNKAYADWRGLSSDEIVGRPIVDVLGAEAFDKLLPHFQTVLSGQKVNYEEELNIAGLGHRWVSASYAPTFDSAGVPDGWVAVVIDINLRKQAENTLAQRTAQQAAVAALGQKALAASSLQELMDEAVVLVANTLGTEYCKFLELLPGGKELLLRAGIGWSGGLIGHATVGTGRGSQAGYTLLCAEPVIVSDLCTESRFRGPSLLRDHGIVSGISCLIAGSAGQPYGVVGAHTKRHREFSKEDVTFLQSIANIVGSAIQRRDALRELEQSESRMRAVLDAAVDAMIIIDQCGVIETVNPATEQMFQYAKVELIGQNVKILVPPPYCDEHDDYIRRYLETGTARIIGIGREVIGRRKDGSTFPVDLAVSELKHLGLFTGVLRDITRRKELEKQVLDAATDEQHRIGQDIHDGLGQELTGLRYMAQTHAESLTQQGSPDAKTAQRISEWLETVQRQLRAIIRELVPVELDKDGLIAALRDLSKRTRDLHRLACDFECEEAVAVDDRGLATHLYRIAQEAVHNAVRHAEASRIILRLAEDNDTLRLQVADNGVGIGSERDSSTGVGIPSMAYRAGLIGAHLRIERAEKGGTVVTCIAPKRRREGQRREP